MRKYARSNHHHETPPQSRQMLADDVLSSQYLLVAKSYRVGGPAA